MATREQNKQGERLARTVLSSTVEEIGFLMERTLFRTDVPRTDIFRRAKELDREFWRLCVATYKVWDVLADTAGSMEAQQYVSTSAPLVLNDSVFVEYCRTGRRIGELDVIVGSITGVSKRGFTVKAAQLGVKVSSRARKQSVKVKADADCFATPVTGVASAITGIEKIKTVMNLMRLSEKQK